MASDLANFCLELSYRLRLPLEKFDLAAFNASLGKKAKRSPDWNRIALRESQKGGFHCHLSWRPSPGEDKDTIQVQVDFHQWKSKSKTPLEKPTTDEVYEWVSRFTPVREEEVHVHAEFSLLTERWQLTVLPIPWTLPYGQKSPVVVDGVAFSLPSARNGVSAGYASVDEKLITLQLFATRKLELTHFDITRDIDDIAVVAKDFVGEKQ